MLPLEILFAPIKKKLIFTKYEKPYVLHNVNMNITWPSDDKAEAYCHNCNYETNSFINTTRT